MVLTLFKILSLCCLLLIAIQDFKERKVYLWLLICGIAFMSQQFFYNVEVEIFLSNALLNLSIILVILGILYLYTNFKLKIKFSKALGLGDILFFLGIAISFPAMTFILLFSFSLLFAFVLFLILKPILKMNTVPLAGLQALFFFLIISVNWQLNYVNLYFI
jgi:hypothetical protein